MESLLSPMVQVVLEKVSTAMLNKAQVIANIGGEVKKLKEGLEATKALLADTMNLRNKYETVKGTLTQLREVIDEADNVLTDCLIRDIYKENSAFPRFLFHDMGFQNRVGNQLVDINTKIDKARNMLGPHLKPATSPDRTNHGSEDMNQRESDREFMSSQGYTPPVTYGLDEDIRRLKEWMFGSTKGKLDFAVIVGMGGLGKTTIARKVFTDTQVISHFNKNKMMWVSVTQNFSKKRIVKCMLEKANMKAPDVSESDMFTKLKDGLNDQAYLIVMDDVWQKPNLLNFWNELREVLPTKVGKSSCIIITTRNEDVAKDIVNSLIVRPPKLNEKHSWSLFSSFAFQSYEGKCPSEEFKKEGNVIVNKCGGLPLAIKTIGGCLARESRLVEWRKTSEKFHASTTDGKTDEVMVWLKLSYDELSTDLKQCLLCVSVYPEDFEIHADQLIHWWLGDGLIQGKEGYSKTALELGHEHLAELANRCLLEVVDRRSYDGRIHKFGIHDMVRELITNIAEKEKFCYFNEEGVQINIEDSRWLCLTEDMAAEVKKPWIQSKTKLRALLLMSSPSLIDFGRNFVLLESLRVLDLSYSKLDVISVEDNSTLSSGICGKKFFQLITSLKRLACLNLSGVQKLLEVTSKIKKLLNLQVLVLYECKNLGKIHAKISWLKGLVVLDIRTCPCLQHLPRELGSLYRLQELSGFKVVSRAKTRGCTLLELGKLKQLRVLRITICDLAEISEEEKKSLSSLQSLKVLDVDANTCIGENLKMIDELGLPPNIEELYLRNNRSTKMPKWFHHSRLDKLHYLSIENCDFESLQENSCIWYKIEGLYLNLLQRLKVDWNDLISFMPALCHMEISSCSNLRNFPIDVVKGGVWPNKK